jgi:hypothetical protein
LNQGSHHVVRLHLTIVENGNAHCVVWVPRSCAPVTSEWWHAPVRDCSGGVWISCDGGRAPWRIPRRR